MNSDVFDNLFEDFNEFDEEVIIDNVFDSLFEGFNEFDDADPEMLAADDTGTTVA